MQEQELKSIIAALVLMIPPQLAAAGSIAPKSVAATKDPLSNPIPTFYVSAFVTNPQIVTVSLISGFTMHGTSSDNAGGVFFELEPGLAGAKVAVGRGMVGAHGMHQYWKGAILRTWRDPWGMHANETFVGAEAATGDIGLSFRIGAYGEVSGGRDNWLISGGVGFFFS